jgi:hypothetical protein
MAASGDPDRERHAAIQLFGLSVTAVDSATVAAATEVSSRALSLSLSLCAPGIVP